MLLVIVQGTFAQTKTTPRLALSYEQSSTTVGGSIGSVKLTVTDGSNHPTSIRSRFVYRYTIVTSDGKEITTITGGDGKDIIEDPNTGSSVQYRYGIVEIGNKAGSFSVKVSAEPTDEYASLYNSTSVTFPVTVNTANPTMTVRMGDKVLANGSNDAQITLYSFEDWKYAGWHDGGKESKFMPMPLPIVGLTHDIDGRSIQDNKYYNITYRFADGDKFSTDGKTMTAIDGATEDNNGTLTITATPTAAAAGVVAPEAKTFSVKVALRKIADDKKIKTYIRWAHGRELTHYRTSSNLTKDGVTEKIERYSSLVPTIVDEYGNDVTLFFDLQFGMYDDNGNFIGGNGKPMDVIHKYSNDPLDQYPGWEYSKKANDKVVVIENWDFSLRANGNHDLGNVFLTTYMNEKAPDDYLITVNATPFNNPWGDQKYLTYSNIYQIPQYESAAKEAKKEKTTIVHGMLYGHEKAGAGSNVYELQPNQYIYHCLKRAPSLIFDHNPQSVIPTDFEINPGNRFKPKGVMVDTTIDTNPTDSLIYKGKNHFTYYIFIPDELAWTAADGENPKDANGNPIVKVEICDDGYGHPAGASNTDEKSLFYWKNEGHQYVYDIDKDGNVIKNADGTPKGEIKTGKRYFTKQDWNNDDLRIKFHGTGSFPMTYTIVPWNTEYWDIGLHQTISLNIKESVPTHFVINPETIVTAKGKVSAAPKVRIVDDAGNDVTKYFDIAPTKANQSDGYNLGDGNNGIAKYAINPWATSDDGFKINVNATLNAEGKQQRYGIPEQGTYTIIVKDATSANLAEYEIMYDPDLYSGSTGLSDNSATSDMGKFHFIKDGDFYPGTIVQDEIPGIDIQIGTPLETNKGIVYNVSNKSLLLNNTVVPDGTDIPTTGFIRVMALTNGFLSIDALFHPGDLWILRDINTHEEQELTDDKEVTAQKTYSLPLIAGHTYALWSDRMSGYINGLNFDPQFISLNTDHEGWHDATTFQNGYTGTLPELAEREVPTISYYLRDVASKSSTSVEKFSTAVSNGYTSGYHAHVNTTTGQVNAIELTADNSLTTANGAEMDNRVTIVASVLGKKRDDGKQVEKRPHYNLYIGAMPTYIVEDGANFDMGNRISTNNIPTRIWMTFGGWTHVNDDKYPYRKSINGMELNDDWKTAMMDPVGRDDMTIDNFNYSTIGQEIPVDEDIKDWKRFREAKPWNHENAKNGTLETLDGQRNGFMAPVRGSYLKFEPEESGKLFLYILQDGMTDVAKGDDTGEWDKSDAQYLRRRALYIIDETGNNVEIPDGNEGWAATFDEYLPSDRKTVATRFKGYTIPNRNYYCGGTLRAGWADGSLHKESSADGYKTFQIDQSADGKYSWLNSYDHTAEGLTKKGRENLDADVSLVTNWWKNNYNKYTASGARTIAWSGHEKLGGPDEVLRLSDGGFVLPTKGYVRYTFNVRAGKTYYVFMPDSKLGFCGFGFLPAGYTQHSVKWINAVDSIDNPRLGNKAGFKKEVYDKLPKPTETEVFAASNTTKNDESNEIGANSGTASTVTGVIGGTTVTLDASLTAANTNSYKNQLAKIFTTRDSIHQFVDVNLKRKFMKRHWSGICLPFSVSENQVKRVFGDHTSVITLDSVRFASGPKSKDYRTLHFTRHVIQNIEAGRPYYIYPDGEAISDTTGTGDNVVFTYNDGNKTVNGLQFRAVTFENVKPMDLICYNEDAYNNGSDIFTYRVAGLYDCGDIPFYSYYMRLGTNDKSQNNLSRVVPANENVTTLPQLTGYNTYLYPHSSDSKGRDVLNITHTSATNAKAASFWVTGGEVSGGEVTGIKELIDEVNTEATSFVDGVYTVDGKKVCDKNSLDNLPAGVYIMKGKKYIVK